MINKKEINNIERLNKILIWPIFTLSKFIGYSVSFFFCPAKTDSDCIADFIMCVLIIYHGLPFILTCNIYLFFWGGGFQGMHTIFKTCWGRTPVAVHYVCLIPQFSVWGDIWGEHLTNMGWGIAPPPCHLQLCHWWKKGIRIKMTSLWTM